MCAGNKYFTSLEKNSPNLIKGSLQTQGNKKDLVNEWTQRFRRKLWARQKCPLEGPKAAPFVSQPCPGDPAVPRGHLLTCTYLTGPKKAAGCMLPPTCGCVFTMELPQEQRRNETFQARYFQVCTKKTANDHERTGTHRITCVSTHDCKNPHGLNVPKPTPI